ncbi:uncharacterized protein LOC135695472 [Rhopilema esculentum]|uniref:uncharacterized protein LOC135695472 n=1 Tax=Rhopilema esculentum TaxID=499914 RepID=UPI0031D82361|eukprot:gene11234-21421_t
MFSKSKSIELGGIQPEFDSRYYDSQPRRKSHADIEKLKHIADRGGHASRSLQSSLRSVAFEIGASSEEFLEYRDVAKSYGAVSKSLITQDTLDKIRDVELEDVLMNARNITDPDPTANMSFCPRPARVIEGSFRHSVSVKEVDSKTGAFRHRTIEILRKPEDELGFSVRRGDGWEKDDGIFVSRINLGSVFDKFELMRVGDEIVKINRIDMKNMDVEDVVRLMHIPEKLSITIKILTPFSKKRIANSTIANGTKTRQAGKFDFIDSKNTNSSIYKIAHMKIGKSVENAKKSHETRESKKTDAESKEQAKKEDSNKTATVQQEGHHTGQALRKDSYRLFVKPHRRSA